MKLSTDALVKWRGATVVDHCSLIGALAVDDELMSLPYRLGLESGQELDPIFRVDQLTSSDPICGKAGQWDRLLNEGSEAEEAAVRFHDV